MLRTAIVVALACVAALIQASPLTYVAETFDTNPFTEGRWKTSKHSKYVNQPIEVMASVTAPEAYKGDLGVQLTKEMRHYGFGTSFDPIMMTGEQPLIVQYEVKFDEPLTCGGAYIKLLRSSGESIDIDQLTEASPYAIMFGPDKCGATDKVHFIFQHQNPVSKVWEEKHFNETINVKSDTLTHLYTLELFPTTNTFTIKVDGKVAHEGNLLTHMNPPINPPAEIDDPTDLKPADWVDDEQIEDATAVKPDDWDETQPRKIPDPAASKPADWLDDEAEEIPNPEVSKPEDWDDEEDGEWEAPLVPNPRCLQASGCGRWTAPLVDNPLFKGPWRRPLVPNPAFVGHWRPRQIPNPDFFEDNSPVARMAPIAGLAVEVWTTSAGIHFDNFLVTRDAAELADFVDKFRAKHAAEKSKLRMEQANREAEINSYRNQASFMMMQAVHTLTSNPAALAATLLGMLAAFVLVCCGCRGWSKKPLSQSPLVSLAEGETLAQLPAENNDVNSGPATIASAAMAAVKTAVEVTVAAAEEKPGEM